MIQEKVKEQEKEATTDNQNTLFLFNDDVNSFDFVIDTLVEVCGHDSHQAEQCAMIAHYNGKCPVFTASRDDLEPMMYGMIDKGLSVQIV